MQDLFSIFDKYGIGSLDINEINSIFNNPSEVNGEDKQRVFEFKSEIYKLIKRFDSHKSAQKMLEYIQKRNWTNVFQK